MSTFRQSSKLLLKFNLKCEDQKYNKDTVKIRSIIKTAAKNKFKMRKTEIALRHSQNSLDHQNYC